MNNLNSTQEVSTNTTNSVTIYLNLQDTVQVDDSVSNVSEVISNVEVAIPNIDIATNASNALLNVDPMFISTTVSGIQYIDPITMLIVLSYNIN
jgi:hypothetical protein